MPGRQAHGDAPVKKPRQKKDNRKRSQNAFAIASHEVEDNIKIRKHRLGNLEGSSSRPKKRSRNEDEDDEEDADSEEERAPKKKAVKKGRFDELDIDAGSDSDGNEWQMGEAGDDDSDLDSDEAFGESDEEKFDGYAFSGSSAKSKKAQAKKVKALTLDEEESASEDGDSDDSLGEEAIDLATMLDQTADSDEEEVADDKAEIESSGEERSEDEDESDDESSASSMDEDDDDDVQDPEKLAALQSLIANLPQEATKTVQRQRSDGASEYNAPSDFGVTSRTKLTLDDLGLGAVKDANIKKSIKLLDTDSKKKSATLAVPLARRQQDRIDRAAAYEESKKTLDRWQDTVKHNRRAEHLIFPLPDADRDSMAANTRLQSTNTTKPFNELEAAIQSIMEESGLAAANGKDDEDKIREYEELETNKLSLEDVKARRDQLRMARELMFREESKAKRVKKIKSKAYRRVHRKERERQEEKDREAMREAGIEPSEDEQEAQDRRRATERMGDKHRGSKWAKATKATGRAAWDEDARAGVTEMARRDEELRKRVEGRTSKREDYGSESSADDSADDDSDDDVATGNLRSKLDKLSATSSMTGPGSKLANMAFMLKADAVRKKANDDMIKEIKRDLDGGESSGAEQDEEMDIGRRIFGPGTALKQENKQVSKQAVLAELEERLGSSDEDEVDFKLTNDQTASPAPRPNQKPGKRDGPLKAAHIYSEPAASNDHEGGAWTKVLAKKKGADGDSENKRRRQRSKATDADELDITNAAVIAKQAQPAKSAKNKSSAAATFMADGGSDSESSDDQQVKLPFAIRDQELIKRAFQGDTVVEDFEAEKRATIMDEDEKVVDNAIPGWGSWIGDGVSKREKNKNKGRFLTKTEGIKEANRKDARLKNVIINEKRVKKNTKYLASSLPHTFETKAQYERSLRMPVGPEWTTKETFQDATKPRILLKQGIIKPMHKPLM